ncbi:hypothetical protein QBC44DRAFT_164238 [Cladorrhinum sp. PSN332]|nr:hypothetical protein QBC44DRAFT_164238 [Cladorrhinum sp. PSN332]
MVIQTNVETPKPNDATDYHASSSSPAICSTDHDDSIFTPSDYHGDTPSESPGTTPSDPPTSSRRDEDARVRRSTQLGLQETPSRPPSADIIINSANETTPDSFSPRISRRATVVDDPAETPPATSPSPITTTTRISGASPLISRSSSLQDRLFRLRSPGSHLSYRPRHPSSLARQSRLPPHRTQDNTNSECLTINPHAVRASQYHPAYLPHNVNNGNNGDSSGRVAINSYLTEASTSFSSSYNNSSSHSSHSSNSNNNRNDQVAVSAATAATNQALAASAATTTMAPLRSTNPFEALEVYDASRSPSPSSSVPEGTVAAPIASAVEAAVVGRRGRRGKRARGSGVVERSALGVRP